jgi:hypothetical protein
MGLGLAAALIDCPATVIDRRYSGGNAALVLGSATVIDRRYNCTCPPSAGPKKNPVWTSRSKPDFKFS